MTGSVTHLIGLIIFFAGLFLIIWARLCLGKNWRWPMSKRGGNELITVGPYTYVRHPIYSGILLSIIGIGCINSPYWFIVLIVMAAFFIYVATAEEEAMLKRFPKTYRDYIEKTKLFIPFIL